MKTDSAIKDKKEDLLDRYDFAKEIVSGLLNSFKSGQDSIAIGIHGEWGSGKSSVLSFIETELKEQTKDDEKRNIIFHFNPWMITGQIELQKSFLTQLGLHLRTINPELKKIGSDIILAAHLLEIINIINPDLFAKQIIKSGAKFVKTIAEKIGNEPSIEVLKNRIDELLETSSIKLFIIIDDVDRLGSLEISEILKLVKLNASFKNSFFFLAFDKIIVADAINKEFSVNGEQFLEKIIQLDYSLPKLQSDIIEQFFFSHLLEFAKRNDVTLIDKDFGRVWQGGLKDFYTNLRHIYRLFNAMNVRYPCIKNDVNLIDFIAIETIRIFDHKAFEWVYENKNALTNERLTFRAYFENEKKLTFSEFINSQRFFINNPKSKSLIITIFNSIHFSVFSMGNEQLEPVKLEIEKRVTHFDFFDHYFAFKISKNNLPQSVINLFLSSSDLDKEKLLNEHIDNKLHLFLKRITQNLKEQDFNIDLFNFFLDYSDKYNLHSKKITSSYNLNGLHYVFNFLNDNSNKFGFEVYLEAILKSGLSYSRFYLQSYLKNLIENFSNIEPVKDFPKELVLERKSDINTVFLENLELHSKYYLENPLNHKVFIIENILRYLSQIKPEEYEEKVKNYLQNVEEAIMLLRCNFKVIISNGEHKYYAIDDEHMLPNLNIARFDKIFSNARIEDYAGDTKDFLMVFFKIKENGFKPNYYYTKNLDLLKY